MDQRRTSTHWSPSTVKARRGTHGKTPYLSENRGHSPTPPESPVNHEPGPGPNTSRESHLSTPNPWVTRGLVDGCTNLKTRVRRTLSPRILDTSGIEGPLNGWTPCTR